ncbi:MAG: hypothetical protein AAFY39_15690, partial [Pseudomonadota bacterium]
QLAAPQNARPFIPPLHRTPVQFSRKSARAFCGAANCRIDVFLSSRGYANPEELLAITADFVQNAQGRVGVLLAGTASVCADGFCDTPFYWNGITLAQ